MTTFLKKTFTLFLVAAGASAGFAQTHADGLAAMQLEHWDKAIQIYATLTKSDPADQVAWLTLGSAYLAKGDRDRAKATFDAAFNAKSEGPYAMIASGRILLLQGEQAKADEIFKKAKKYGKKDITTFRLIGEAFLFNIAAGQQKPNFARAEETFKEAIDLSAKDFATLMAIAYCYKEMPNGGLAAQHYEYAASLEPGNPLPLYMLAKVYRAAKIYEKFLVYIDKAIALNPKYSEALRAKAEYLYYDKKWEAATVAAKALVNNGAEVTIEDEMLLANLLYITKDCKGCSELVDRILKKDGSKNYLRRLQAYCHFDNGNYSEGLRILEEFFKQVTPDKVLPSDYEYLAKLQVKTGGDTTVAIRNYRKAIELDSSKWTLYEEIGNLLYNMRNYCQAAPFYQMNVDSVKSPSGTQYYRLGLCHYYCTEDSLHFEKAEKSFARVTEIVPDAGSGWAWRAKAMSKLEPDIVNHPELLEEFGKAKFFFDKFVAIGEADPVKNKRDLIISYEYLASYYFLKKDDEQARVNLAKLFALDPTNQNGLDIQKFLEGETPVPPTNGGGKG
ncbi:MAG: tetratricopeptide repeat protein [Saprospirales bacterium]|nr:tetratricopeptide repeat protein [Saprospirales bacterium]MBK8923296.1 tetratricopeptide repeat protein [Saprospirales bacterium]